MFKENLRERRFCFQKYVGIICGIKNRRNQRTISNSSIFFRGLAYKVPSVPVSILLEYSKIVLLMSSEKNFKKSIYLSSVYLPTSLSFHSSIYPPISVRKTSVSAAAWSPSWASNSLSYKETVWYIELNFWIQEDLGSKPDSITSWWHDLG